MLLRSCDSLPVLIFVVKRYKNGPLVAPPASPPLRSESNHVHRHIVNARYFVRVKNGPPIQITHLNAGCSWLPRKSEIKSSSRFPSAIFAYMLSRVSLREREGGRWIGYVGDRGASVVRRLTAVATEIDRPALFRSNACSPASPSPEKTNTRKQQYRMVHTKQQHVL